MLQRVIELKFFGRAISNDKKADREIRIQRVAVQLTDGGGGGGGAEVARASRGIPITIAADAYAKV